MPDQLPEELIEERHARLLKAVDEIRVRKLNDYVGRRMEILVEGPSRRNAARLEGRTRCNKIVVFEGGERFVGQVMDVEIESASPTTLVREPGHIKPQLMPEISLSTLSLILGALTLGGGIWGITAREQALEFVRDFRVMITWAIF